MALSYTDAQRVTKAKNILDYLMNILETEMSYQNTNGPRATYSLGGQSVSWDTWLAGMQKAIRDQQEYILLLEPFAIVSRVRT